MEPSSAKPNVPATCSTSQKQGTTTPAPKKGRKKVSQKGLLDEVNEKLELISNLVLDFGKRVCEMGTHVEAMDNQLASFDLRLIKQNSQVSEAKQGLLSLKAQVADSHTGESDGTSSSSENSTNETGLSSSDADYSPVRGKYNQQTQKTLNTNMLNTPPPTASSDDESDIDRGRKRKRPDRHTPQAPASFSAAGISHSTTIGRGTKGMNERSTQLTFHEDQDEREEGRQGGPGKSGGDEPRRPPLSQRSRSLDRQVPIILQRYNGGPRKNSNKPSLNASGSSVDPNTFGSKSLQKMHERAIKVMPYKGPEDDPRAALAYLEQFESRVVNHLGNDHICGEIFYDQIEQSPWCQMWINKIRADMGYKRMAKIFLQLEWTMEVQNLFYLQFLQANQRNTPYSNFLDFYNYWKERIKGVKVGDGYVIEHFRNNMPTRVQMKVNIDTVKTLKKFDKIIKKIPKSDLAWHDLSMPQGIAKRKEALARRRGNLIPTPVSQTAREYVYKNNPKYPMLKSKQTQTTYPTFTTNATQTEFEQFPIEQSENC